MPSLISAHSVSKSHGSHSLFTGLSLSISDGDRIGLIGPNGAGKTTLIRILMGLEEPDSGSVSRRQGLSCGYASQAPDFPDEAVEDVLAASCRNVDPEEASVRARVMLGKLQCADPLQSAALLSGGWKKRLDIARSCLSEPDLLFLDEPTNHLDVEGILWLEKLLLREARSYVVVSHDRTFLETVCTSIVEINPCFPGGLFVCDGTMSVYIERKRDFLKAQEAREQGLASVVRSEVAWLRRSPAARTTKSRSRIQKAYELIDELSATTKRNTTSTVDLEFVASERETRKLLAAKNLTKALDGKTLFRGIDLVLSPGSRLGVVGRNGSGKTTFLKVLAGMVSQDSGTIKYADGLRLVYFDQHREHLPQDITLRQALSPNGEFVNYRGQQIHVHGWARKFLFSQDRLQLPIKYLSGGERARILIARLMLEPADILFLDEPTNDLDIPTLEVIEESLLQFPGAVVLISHDRCMMDRLCTQILGLGQGEEQQFFADYDQWLRYCQSTPSKERAIKAIVPEQKSEPTRPNRLTYKEQRELSGMEEAIGSVEEKIASIEAAIAASPSNPTDLYQNLANFQTERDRLFSRWQDLLNLQG